MGSHTGCNHKSGRVSPRLIAAILFLLAPTLIHPQISAQTSVPVSVQVSADKPVNILTSEALGIYTDIYDAATTRPIVAGYLNAAGIHTLRYPGGYGSYADLYHWTTNSGTHYQNFKPAKERFYAGENSMGNMVQFFDKVGTAIITVNYGSNVAGTGGGEPAEAAAWVAYANGDSADPKAIGKDSTGQDWKTVGYWATLRGQAPLPQDDGLNLLRGNHPRPLAIKLWEIGSEVYNNGYYGGDHKDEEDLHAPYPPDDKDNERRRKNPNLSPSFYAARVVDYARAMKAVDPSVWIGASLNLAPDDTHWGPEWNGDVLKGACKSIDFISLAWRPGDTMAPDYKTRDEASVLRAPQEKLGKILAEVIYNEKRACPADHLPRVAFTQIAPIHWAKSAAPIVDALFAADALALLIESGTINIDWVELHDPLFLNDSNQRGPAYYGIQMLHIVAYRPGDRLLSVTSNRSSLAVHAAQRIDGSLGLILINKDPNAAAEIKVSVAGGSFAAQGSRFDYGPEALKATAPPAKTPFKAGGASFSVTVPPYTITDIVLLKAE